MRRATGLTVIIRYKFAKAAAEALTSLVFVTMGSQGSVARLVNVARLIQHHATEAWSVRLAEALLNASTPHHVRIVEIALLADAFVTALEGWALQRGYAWSRWLVVLTTASLLPFEVDALVHHPNALRAVFFLVNVVIVLYLLKRHDPAQATAARGAPTT